jgi:hypothetical protein
MFSTIRSQMSRVTWTPSGCKSIILENSFDICNNISSRDDEYSTINTSEKDRCLTAFPNESNYTLHKSNLKFNCVVL